MRIWRETSDGSLEFVSPTNHQAGDLELSASNNQLNLVIEGINGAATTNIVVIITEEGVEIGRDTVAVTVVVPNIGVNNSNNTHDFDAMTHDDLRPGVPDVEFEIDERDEMVEDQSEGFRFWWSRDQDPANPGSVTMNGIVDLAPFVVDIPQELVDEGFRFYLQVDGAQLYAYSAVGPGREFLQNATKAVSQIAEPALSLSNGTPTQITVNAGGRYEFVFKATGSGDANVRLSLLVEEPDPSQNRIVTDSARLAFRETSNFWLLASTRGNGVPTEPFEYPTDDGRVVPQNQFHRYPAPQEYSGGITGYRDPARAQHLIWVHGYNNSERAAVNTFNEMYRQLFWLGFRGNFIGLAWHSDESSGILPPVVLFDTQVQNAFQSAPSFMLFLQNQVRSGWGALPENINVVAHSLGNFVAYDALRLHRRASNAPLIKNLIGLESATWPECYLTETDVINNGGIRYTSDPITYTSNELKQHSWAFWFGQLGNEVPGALTGDIFHSHIPNDQMLYWMRRNDGIQRGFPTLTKGWHYRRDQIDGLPAGFRSPIEEPGHPNFYNDVPTLMLQPNQRHVPYGWWRLNLPVGTSANPMAHYNYPALLDQTWPSGEHSAYLWPLPVMYRWYGTFFAGEGNAPYSYPPAIPIGEE
jgi:hypothetical protein